MLFSSQRLRYSHIRDSREDELDTQKAAFSILRSSHVFLFFWIGIAIIAGVIGFWLGRASTTKLEYTNLPVTQAANGRFLKNIVRELDFDEKFGLSPSPETDEAWSSLFPSMFNMAFAQKLAVTII